MSDLGQLVFDARKSAVEQAKARLTLADLWDLAPHSTQSHPPANGLGVVRSPLREDRSPSFSIFDHGRAFADKARADVKGSVWDFVALCCPQMKGPEIGQLLAERAGLRWPMPEDFREQARAGAAQGDEARAKRLREERLARQRAEKAQADRAEMERRAERDGRGRRAETVPDWPDCVRARWEEGAAYRDAAPAVVAKLCDKRGWPVAWADMLAALDLVAFPLEPWCEPGREGAKLKRMVAFRVEAPRLAGGRVALAAVGYHQKFFNLASKESGWRFLPNAKRPARALAEWSSYQRAVVEAARERGAEEGRSMVPPLPFVVGCVERPRLVIIVEGQWDALTMLGALEGLHPDGHGPRDVAFFGIRGINGTRAFVDHWGEWLRAVKPLVWLLPDNDGAKTGGGWFPPPRATERRPGTVYFSERLRFLGASRVVVTPLRADSGTGGKDFNDYYKAARPDAAAMWRWMETLKLV
jgi:hypothetical protein